MGTNENNTSGVSRRDLLKKGAVAGGIVWTAPMVLSISDVAGASYPGSAGSLPPCTKNYVVKWNLSESGSWSGCQGEIGGTCLTGDYESGCTTAYGPPSAAGGGTYVVYIDARLGKSSSGPYIQQVSGSTNGGQPGAGRCGPAGVEYVAPNGTYPNGAWKVTFVGNAPNGSGLSNASVSWCA